MKGIEIAKKLDELGALLGTDIVGLGYDKNDNLSVVVLNKDLALVTEILDGLQDVGDISDYDVMQKTSTEDTTIN